MASLSCAILGFQQGLYLYNALLIILFPGIFTECIFIYQVAPHAHLHYSQYFIIINNIGLGNLILYKPILVLCLPVPTRQYRGTYYGGGSVFRGDSLVVRVVWWVRLLVIPIDSRQVPTYSEI